MNGVPERNTIVISHDLKERIKSAAQKQGTSIRAWTEAALKDALPTRGRPRAPARGRR